MALLLGELELVPSPLRRILRDGDRKGSGVNRTQQSLSNTTEEGNSRLMRSFVLAIFMIINARSVWWPHTTTVKFSGRGGPAGFERRPLGQRSLVRGRQR
jgi:hypothetical protein